MLISVITVTYNSALTVLDTILSVNNQTYPCIEHIFVDGGSNDGTLDIVHQYSKRNPTVISERDSGLYDAMNKGIASARGDYICILNSDDVFASVGTVQWLVSFVGSEAVELVYGDVVIFDQRTMNFPIRRYSSKSFSPESLSMALCQLIHRCSYTLMFIDAMGCLI